MDDGYIEIEIEPYEEIVDRAEVFSTPIVGVDRPVQCPLIGISQTPTCAVAIPRTQYFCI